MAYLFEVDRTIKGIGKEEVDRICGQSISLSDKFVLFKGLIKLNEVKRLGLVTNAYQIIIRSQEDDFLERIREVEWRKYYNKNFCVRKHETRKPVLNERKIADEVWLALKEQDLTPKTNLINPATKLIAIKEAEEMWLCKEIWKRDSFKERRPDKRPALHPSSMHPKIARALINISGVKRGYLIDPFCGSGGILIEAALLGYKVKGLDIDGAMLGRAKKNLDFFGLKVELEKKDATELDERCDLIVTDPPYGKNTKKTRNLEELFKQFLERARSYCNVAIMVFPGFLNAEKITKEAGFKIEKSWTQYIHKSLSRIFCRLVPVSSS